MKLLLMVIALVEGVTGAALFAMPRVTVSYLLNTPLDTPAGVVAGRLAGAALISLAVACWQARNGERSGVARAIVVAMLFYNEAAAVILVYASLRLSLQSIFIWPVFLVHEALAAWCIVNLWVTQRRSLKAGNSKEDVEALQTEEGV